MKRRFVMIGGFLGAGKTTAIGRLAQLYTSRGQRVALVTNDQAQDLVDTNVLRSQGFAVAEVAGACFCCKFDDLIAKVRQLEESTRPDVILAEPVGSCTDLVATVVQPLRDLYGEDFEVAPYPVLFKPSQGLSILRRGPGSGFSAKAEYIFCKQLEEADAIVVNRIDEAPPAMLAEICQLVTEQYPNAPVLKISAKTGQGFEALTELLDQQGPFGRNILDIDYDIYAEGEAELGWLNATLHVRAGEPFDLDGLLIDMVSDLHEAFGQAGAEVAHLKVIALGEPTAMANLVSSASRPVLSIASNRCVTDAELIVNARVAIDPAELEEHVRRSAAQICSARGSPPEFLSMQSFRPGRPQPTHRYAVAR